MDRLASSRAATLISDNSVRQLCHSRRDQAHHYVERDHQVSGAVTRQGVQMASNTRDREDDSKWPQKNKDGRQELEIRLGNDHISFEVRSGEGVHETTADRLADGQDRLARGRDRIRRPRGPPRVLLPRARPQGSGLQPDFVALQNQAYLVGPRVIGSDGRRAMIRNRHGSPPRAKLNNREMSEAEEGTFQIRLESREGSRATAGRWTWRSSSVAGMRQPMGWDPREAGNLGTKKAGYGNTYRGINTGAKDG